MTQIKFTRETNFTGRNGYFKCSGLDLLAISRNELMLSPVTSRGMIGRCDISIPIEDIPALIDELQAFVSANEIDFTRIGGDTYGNPRYVCHFLTFIAETDKFDGLDSRYDLALQRSRQFGGKKFHNKQYGGGIVFQSYNIDGLAKKIATFMAELNSEVKK